MKQLTTLIELQRDAMSNGLTGAAAAAAAEKHVIQQFSAERRETFNNASYHMARAIMDKDRSRAMSLIHGIGDVLDANAEEINAALSSFAAGMTQNRFVWTAKEQSSLVTRVLMGTKTKMVTKDSFEYKGFSGTDLRTFLMTQTKEEWGARASQAVMQRVSEVLESLARDTGVKGEAVGINDKAPKQYGTLAYKFIWKGVGSIASKAAMFERDARYVKVTAADGVTTENALVTDKLERMVAQLERMDSDDKAVMGNSYAQDLQDEIVEYRHKLDVWEAAYEIWNEELGALVAEWNEIQEVLTGADIRLPTGELEAMHQWQYKATMEKMEALANSVKVQEFNSRLEQSAAEARAKFETLLNK